MGLIYAIILIGVLIFVHELGHFVVAKFFDVKVLRFSIGFGPRIASFQRGETEYCICALPLGGYVQMLGMDFAGAEEIPPEDRDRALMAKPIWQRSLISFAGPFFNLFFPVLIYFVVTMTLTTMPPAMVGDVFDEMPAAAAGLQPGDRIVAIDGEKVDYWYEVIDLVTTRPGEELELTYERDGEQHDVTVVPEPKSATDFLGLATREYGLIGIHPGTYGPVLGIAEPDGPAAKAGLENFDKVLAINGEPVKRYDRIESMVRSSGGKPLEFTVLRRNPVSVDYGQFYRQNKETVTVVPDPKGKTYTIGTDRAEMFIARVEPDSPAAKAGLQVGDEVLAVDGKSFSNWRMMDRNISNDINEKIVAKTKEGKSGESVSPSFEIEYRRNGEVATTTLKPQVLKLDKQDFYNMHVGWGHMGATVFPDEVHFPILSRLSYGAEYAVEQTWEFCRMTVMGFVRMAQGRLSLSNVGGPIMIGELAAQAGDAGWDKFLEMMALISINLGIINLLPIPILDGGHLMLYAIEAVKRRPLSFRARQIAAYIGFTMIIFLIVLAFKNDIERQWDNITEIVNEI